MGSEVPVRTQQLWDSLAVETDESAVLSVVYEKTANGEWALRCGSLIVGPVDIEAGWPAWRLAEGHHPKPSERDLAVPATFCVDLGNAVAGRLVLSLSDAVAWARSTLEQRRCPPAGSLPSARADIAPALAPIRVSTQSETDAGALAVWLARPIQGFHFPAREISDLRAGPSWKIDGVDHFSPAIAFLGIGWFDSRTGDPPAGLLIGRMERRGWLAGQRFRPEDDLYSVHIGTEPDRLDVADLEIEVEERHAGELVIAERLRLEDTDLRAASQALYGRAPTPGTKPTLEVNLPTLGRSIRRTVRLHHRDGRLLDEWQPFNIVESINVSISVNGSGGRTSQIGESRDEPTLVELLGAVERVRGQYALLRREGLTSRLFDDPREGTKELRLLLERAPGELLVLDPWLRDWALLTGLPITSPRVLIGNAVDVPPPTFSGQVARWRKDHAPFHDRFFLWEGGGVSVGTSAGSTRHRLYRIARIGAAESDELRERFALWWNDPDFERIH